MVRDTAELFGKDREYSHCGSFWRLRLLEEKKKARGSWSGCRTERRKELRGDCVVCGQNKLGTGTARLLQEDQRRRVEEGGGLLTLCA